MLVDLAKGSFRDATFSLEDKSEVTAWAMVSKLDTAPATVTAPASPAAPFSAVPTVDPDDLIANFESYKPSAPTPLSRLSQQVERLELQSQRAHAALEAKVRSQSQQIERQLQQRTQQLAELDQRQQAQPQKANVASAAAGGHPGGGCPSNLSGLRARIPRFSNPTIEGIRSEIVNSDVRQMIQAAKRQGFRTGEMAAEASMRQAQEHDRVAREAAATASSVDAFGRTDEEFMASISSGRLNPATCDGIRNAALCAAVMNKLGAIASRAAAAAMTCHAQAGTY